MRNLLDNTIYVANLGGTMRKPRLVHPAVNDPIFTRLQTNIVYEMAHTNDECFRVFAKLAHYKLQCPIEGEVGLRRRRMRL
jgi:hypothetical protein